MPGLNLDTSKTFVLLLDITISPSILITLRSTFLFTYI